MKITFTNVFRLFSLMLIITKFSYSQTVTTIAGNGTLGYIDGTPLSAEFYDTWAVAFDDTGNVLIVDGGNNRIRKIDHLTGMVSTYAGNGVPADLDGPRLTAEINEPIAIVIDKKGNIIFGESSGANGNRVRKITPAGTVVTIAGNGTIGMVNGPGATAEFNNPRGFCTDSVCNIYVADRYNGAIRKIDTNGYVTTIAGNGTTGDVDGAASIAEFNDPHHVCIDKYGNLFVADKNNNKIRKITPAGIVSTFAGTGAAGLVNGPALSAKFNQPMSISVIKNETFFVGEATNCDIRRISKYDTVTTYTGTGVAGYVDGPLLTAQFNNLGTFSINKSQTEIVIGDLANYRIRKIGIENHEMVKNYNCDLQFNCYPNPVSDMLYVNFDAESQNNIVYSLFDIMGKEVYKSDILNVCGTINKSIDLSRLADGMYFLEVKTDKEIISQKIIVRK